MSDLQVINSYFPFAEKLYSERNVLCTDFQELEILYRTVANRAYYGSYLATKHNLGFKDLEHQQLIDELRKKQNTRGIGNRLKQLKQSRHKADYSPEQDFSARDATRALGMARRIIEELSRVDGAS